jgi:hypothetical protein
MIAAPLLFGCATTATPAERQTALELMIAESGRPDWVLFRVGPDQTALLDPASLLRPGGPSWSPRAEQVWLYQSAGEEVTYRDATPGDRQPIAPARLQLMRQVEQGQERTREAIRQRNRDRQPRPTLGDEGWFPPR